MYVVHMYSVCVHTRNMAYYRIHIAGHTRKYTYIAVSLGAINEMEST